MHFKNVFLTCLVLSAASTGCKREATGQVAAVINDEEVTLQEVNAEIGSANLSNNLNNRAIQQAALQRIIERRLLAQAARADGLDKDPEYIIRKRQLDETLLFQLMGQRTAKSIRVPEPAAIQRYITEHPNVFSERVIFNLDRIQFPMPADPKTLNALADDHSMDAVAAKLTAMGIKFTRGPTQADSATLPPQLLNRIKALPAGEPFVLPENGQVIVAVITGSRTAALTGVDANPLAVQAMRNQELRKTLQNRLNAERAKAKIEYQEGFAPAKAGSGDRAGKAASAQ